MIKHLLPLIAVFALGMESAPAAEPEHELAPQVAVKLIAQKANAPESSIELPFIVDGTAGCGKGFESKHVRRVAAIHPVRDEGGRSTRRLVFYDMLWNESLGWFLWETQPERTGDAVYIWSEIKGHIVNR